MSHNMLLFVQIRTTVYTERSKTTMSVAIMPIEEVFTINEVADMLKFNERTIRRWIQSGRLRAIAVPGRGRAGQEWRIPESAIVELGFEAKKQESDD